MLCPCCKKDVVFVGPITCPNTSRMVARENLRSSPACGDHSGCDHPHSGLLAEDVDLVETGWACGCDGELHLMMPFELWYPLGVGTAADPEKDCVCGSGNRYAVCCERTHRDAFVQTEPDSYDRRVRSKVQDDRDLPTVAGPPGDPCTCGSGKKFKNCCSRRPCSCGKDGKKFGQCCGSKPGTVNTDLPLNNQNKLRIFLKVYGEHLSDIPIESVEASQEKAAADPYNLSLLPEMWLWCLHCERFFQAKDLRHDFTGGREGCAFEDCDGAGYTVNIYPWNDWAEQNDLKHWPKSSDELKKGQVCSLYQDDAPSPQREQR